MNLDSEVFTYVPSPIKTYKIVLVGGPNVGKTKMVRQCRGIELDGKYTPTIGVKVTPLSYEVDGTPYTLNVWDVSGDPRFQGLADGYFHGVDGVVVIGDTNHKIEDGVKHVRYDIDKIKEPNEPFLEILRMLIE